LETLEKNGETNENNTNPNYLRSITSTVGKWGEGRGVQKDPLKKINLKSKK